MKKYTKPTVVALVISEKVNHRKDLTYDCCYSQ